MKKSFNILGKTVILSANLIENKPMEYKYPQIDRSVGYAWNAMQRIQEVVGLRPTVIGDTSGFTYVTFSRELKAQEKNLLDALMADNPTLPPSGTVRVRIKDIYEKLDDFIASSGFQVKLYYNRAPGSTKVDVIELHTDTPLTPTQKNKIQDAYKNLD